MAIQDRDSRSENRFLRGLTIRSSITDCPVGAYHVIVTHCEGKGDCSAVCIVNVFETNSKGQCIVANEELCFGCTACMAQCQEKGVEIVPNDFLDSSSPTTIEDLLV